MCPGRRGVASGRRCGVRRQTVLEHHGDECVDVGRAARCSVQNHRDFLEEVGADLARSSDRECLRVRVRTVREFVDGATGDHKRLALAQLIAKNLTPARAPMTPRAASP